MVIIIKIDKIIWCREVIFKYPNSKKRHLIEILGKYIIQENIELVYYLTI